MGLMTITSRIGAATAPFVVQMTRINAILPFALMGIATFAAAFSCWFLPETRGKSTREVIGDDDDVKDPQEGKLCINGLVYLSRDILNFH